MRARAVVLLACLPLACRRPERPRPAGFPAQGRAAAAYLKFRWAELHGWYAAALEQGRRFLSLDPAACRPAVDVAEYLAELGRPAEALAALKGRCRQVGSDGWIRAQQLRGWVGLALGRRRMARRALGVLVSCPRVECLLARARLLGALGDRAGERTALEMALRRRSDHPGSLFRLIWWHRRRGEADRAAAWARRALAARPEYLRFHLELVRSLVLAGRLVEARRAVARARQEAPLDPGLLAAAVWIALGQGRVRAAEEFVEDVGAHGGEEASLLAARWWSNLARPLRALQVLDPLVRRGRGLLIAAEMALQAGRWLQAVGLFRKGLAAAERSEGLWQAAWRAVRSPACRRFLETARRFLPTEVADCAVGARRAGARALLEAACGARALAIRGARALVERCGPYGPPGRQATVILDISGARRAAVALARRQWVWNPDDAHVVNALAYYQAEDRVRLAESLQLAVQAFRLQPLEPAILDTLGWVRVRIGRLRDGIEDLRVAALRAPADGEIAYHLGEAWWRLAGRARSERERGRLLRTAAHSYRRALALGLTPRLRSQVRKRLAYLGQARLTAGR